MKSNIAKRNIDDLKHDIYSDTHFLDLFFELKILKYILYIDESSPINILGYFFLEEKKIRLCKKARFFFKCMYCL